jgi:hypothetical protein
MDDLHRMATAAHELGHAYAWKHAGFQIVRVWIKGQGPRAHGFTELDGKENQTAEEEAAYLVGLLAGRVAEEFWCDANRVRLNLDDRCKVDMRQYKKVRREKWIRHISDREFRNRATVLVRANWGLIERHIPELSSRGRISV